MKIGYARVSTDEQTLSLQLDALQAAGCENIFSDEGISGTTRDRSGLNDALSTINKDDTLVVWKLDRLGRSLPHLLELITSLGEKGIGFQSLSEQIDTSSAGGRLVFHIMGALAEFEQSLISERTKAGMKAAKRRGIHVGRPQTLSGERLQHMKELLDRGYSKRRVATLLKVSPNTVGRAVKRLG